MNTKTIENNSSITKFVSETTKAIDEYNSDNDIKINVNDFTNINAKHYSNLTLRLLSTQNDPNQIDYSETKKTQQLQIIFGNNSAFNETRTKLYDYVVNRGNIGFEMPFDVYDLRQQYSVISDTRDKIDEQMKKLRRTLAATLRGAITKKLGFTPTVRSIINVFTTAVEVLLSVLYDVSAKAGDQSNKERITQLKKFKNSYDYKSNEDTTTGNNPAGNLAANYYPWPDYNVDGVETYLGTAVKSSDVTELNFIDELLNAFITSQNVIDQAQLELIKETKNWYSVNPLDTKLFTNDFPYKRIEGNTRVDVINLLLIRAMTYIGFTNKALLPEEIQAMANAEAESVLNDITNNVIIQSLTQVSSNDFIEASGTINGSKTKIIKDYGNDYYYDYIFDSSSNTPASFKVIPINSNFTGNWSPNINSLISDSNNGKLFLTNYTTTDKQDSLNNWLYKPNDGGVYVKIMSRETYYNQVVSILPNNTEAPNVLDLKTLKLKYSEFTPSTAGFNQFGGTYGIQEYTKLNYGIDTLEDAPFMYMFYQDANYGDKKYNKSNGLASTRIVSGTEKGKPTKSVFDTTCASTRIANKINDVMNYIDGDEPLHSSYGKNRLLVKDYLVGNSEITYPYVNFQVEYDDASDGNNLAPVSLFGSRFYYEQTSDYSKALLFLHTLPWNGLISVEEEDKLFEFTVNNTIFHKNEILNTFGNRAGFISAPKLWAAFIGAMLWRADYSKPIYDSIGNQNGGGSGLNDPILFGNLNEAFIPTLTSNSFVPTKLQYLTKRQFTSQSGKDYPNNQMTFSNTLIPGNQYKELDSLLLVLPDQAKNEFKQIFFDFVKSSEGSSDWDKIKSQLEIFKGTGSQWVTSYNTMLSAKFLSDNEYYLVTNTLRNQYSVINNGVNNFDNYITFTPILDDKFKYNYQLELKDSTQAVKTLLTMFTSEIIIGNMSYKIWEGNDFNDAQPVNVREGRFVKKSDLKIYIDTLVNKFTSNKDLLSPNNKKKEQEQEIFGTDNENLIKLQLYRTCKNIYDKWVAGSEDDDIVFQGPCGRNGIDKSLAEKRTNNTSAKPSLIDSFRFVTRSFRDIGDELIINPVPINEYLINNPNSSFYDAVTNLLSSNNFDFVALPSYINYGDEQTLQSLFKPMSSSEAFTNPGNVGPSFVCVYVGQTSKNLDFKGSEYSNDGVDFRCDKNGNMIPNKANDFTNESEIYENKVAVFAVNYGQQNQNIFKDITLDQSEFSETAESLQIVDDISKKGSENKKTLAGQNMYNVYSVRSYKTEVEMMGNAMIQPMMYFQLNNIPMFHGAYMITHVKHSIKPNFMSTHFTGVRIKNVETKLMDVDNLFMSLLDSIDSSSIKQGETTRNFGTTTAAQVSGKFSPIVQTIIQNGGTNGKIDVNNIKLKSIPKINGINNLKLSSKNENLLLSEAVDPLVEMLNDWVKWMGENGFTGANKIYAYITSVFRDYQKQVEIKNQYKGAAATPGTSNHGWGIAIDFQFIKKDGTPILNTPNTKQSFNKDVNPALNWLLNNSYQYGWLLPYNLRDGKSLDDHWHFE